jgi:uncharacterized protein YnzC (UPF0291/DUF896 family)
MKSSDMSRLNALAKQKKENPLSIAEASEYAQLKQTYITDIKANLVRHLDEAGNKRKKE